MEQCSPRLRRRNGNKNSWKQTSVGGKMTEIITEVNTFFNLIKSTVNLPHDALHIPKLTVQRCLEQNNE